MKIQLAGALAVTALLLWAGALLGGRSAGAQSAPAVVRAQAFELVDGAGRVRATLDARGFKMLDENGTIRIKLGADANGSGLLLANERTEVGVHALATRARTWLVVQRGKHRRVIRP
jgi:hypothetical protein